MFRSNPRVDRAIGFFTLPVLHRRLARWPECQRSPLGIAGDLLRWFFEYKTFPDNYGPCRLWEVERGDWRSCYGSNYQAYQRAALTRNVQPARYAIVLQDKAVCERLCRDPRITMPRTYGVVGPHDDYRERIADWIGREPTGDLVIKPLSGAAGRGLVVAERRTTGVVVSNRQEETPLDRFSLDEESIVQGMVRQDPRMAAFSLRSLNTIRVVTMLTRDGRTIIVGAALRCGVEGSYVDNWSAGGVAVGVDIDSGRLRRYAHDKHGARYVEHPTTKVRFEGFAVPEWRRVLETATVTQELFPYYRLLGTDIGLGEQGEPVLIEVNDSTDLLFQEQASGPLLRRQEVLEAFGDEHLLVNRHQRELYDEQKSR